MAAAMHVATIAITLLAGIGHAVQAAPAPGSLLPPVTPACISSPFGPRVLPGTRASGFHNGIDLPAPAGAWVHAAAAGQVVQIRRLDAYGLEVDVQHDSPATGRYLTRYAHLGSVSTRLAGGARQVAAGEPIGRVGRTGIIYGTHVYFQLRLNGLPVDPEPFLAVPRCGASRPKP